MYPFSRQLRVTAVARKIPVPTWLILHGQKCRWEPGSPLDCLNWHTTDAASHVFNGWLRMGGFCGRSAPCLLMGSTVNKLQAPVYDILPSFGGRCRKAVLGVSRWYCKLKWYMPLRRKVIWSYRHRTLTYHWVRPRIRDGQQFQAPPAKE